MLTTFWKSQYSLSWCICAAFRALMLWSLPWDLCFSTIMQASDSSNLHIVHLLHNCAIWRECTMLVNWCVHCRSALATAEHMSKCKCMCKEHTQEVAYIYIAGCAHQRILCALRASLESSRVVATDLEFAASKLFSTVLLPSFSHDQEMLRRAASLPSFNLWAKCELLSCAAFF